MLHFNATQITKSAGVIIAVLFQKKNKRQLKKPTPQKHKRLKDDQIFSMLYVKLREGFFWSLSTPLLVTPRASDSQGKLSLRQWHVSHLEVVSFFF